MFSAHSRSAALPRTSVGRWLRAALMRQPALREQLRPTLNGGKPGWNDDEPAVVEAACELAVRRYFTQEYDVRAVADFVAELRLAAGNEPPLDQLRTEAVIRSALGEGDVVTDDITAGQQFHMRVAVIALLTFRLRLDEAAIDKLINDSERIAFERGWHPALVARNSRAHRS